MSRSHLLVSERSTFAVFLFYLFHSLIVLHEVKHADTSFPKSIINYQLFYFVLHFLNGKLILTINFGVILKIIVANLKIHIIECVGACHTIIEPHFFFFEKSL